MKKEFILSINSLKSPGSSFSKTAFFIILSIFLFFAGNPTEAQTVLWFEDFEAEANGVTNGTAAGTPGGTWSVTTTPANGAGSFSKQDVPVVGNSFLINETGSEGVWATNVIDISAYGYAIIDALLASGGFGFDNNDYVRAYYSVDGGAETLFAELVAGVFTGSVEGSAIIAGSTLQVIVRGQDGSTFCCGLGGRLAVDEITVTGVTTLYSIKNDDWSDNTSWSTVNHTGPSCGCLPNDNTVAIIGNSNTINMDADGTSGGVEVRTGTLIYTNTNVDLNISRGFLVVESGGLIDRNGQANARINFTNDVVSTLQTDGSILIDDINITDVATVSISGTGTLSINDDLMFSTSNASITNDLTTTVNIGSSLMFDADNCVLTNNGTISVGSLNAVGAGDDDNQLFNVSGASFSVGDFSLNTADFDVFNSGTINQSGNFLGINPADTNLDNLATGIWNWTLTPNTTYDTDISTVLNCTAAGNIFSYSGAGDQRIIPTTYHHLTLSNSGAKDANNAAISVAGNWLVSGTASFTEGTGTVTFTGSGTQTITNPSGETFYNLVLNTAALANTVQLQDNITVSNGLILTRGGLDINGNSLTIANSATTAVTSTADGYIISETTAVPYSPVIWNAGTTTGTYTIPFGTSTGSLVPVVITKSTAGTQSGTGAFSVATYPTPSDNTPYPSTVTALENGGVDNSANVVDRFWIVDVTGYSALPSASQSLTFLAGEADGGGPTRAAQRWTGTNWDTGVGANTGNTITIPGAVLNASSIWAIASTTTPLPIVLAYYKAMLEGDKVVSIWKTAQEINNHFFTVQKTTDFETFIDVGRLEGQGNSQQEHSYSFIDDLPFIGKSYYRLKQTDFDGKFSYSDPVMINYEGSDNAILIAYPNPFNGKNLSIELAGLKADQQIPLLIYDQRGQKIYETTLSGGQATIREDISFETILPQGIYIIKAGKTLQLIRKIVVN